MTFKPRGLFRLDVEDVKAWGYDDTGSVARVLEPRFFKRGRRRGMQPGDPVLAFDKSGSVFRRTEVADTDTGSAVTVVEADGCTDTGWPPIAPSRLWRPLNVAASIGGFASDRSRYVEATVWYAPVGKVFTEETHQSIERANAEAVKQDVPVTLQALANKIVARGALGDAARRIDTEAGLIVRRGYAVGIVSDEEKWLRRRNREIERSEAARAETDAFDKAKHDRRMLVETLRSAERHLQALLRQVPQWELDRDHVEPNIRGMLMPTGRMAAIWPDDVKWHDREPNAGSFQKGGPTPRRRK